jgi:type 1 glutamine amidotransferase
MTRHIAWLAVAALSLPAAVRGDDPAKRADDAKRPVRVLMVLGSPPFHDIVKLPPILEKTLDRAGGFEIKRLEPPSGKPEDEAHIAKLADLKKSDTDVVLFYTTFLKLGKPEEDALRKFVEDGGGIVALHGAMFSFTKSEFWRGLLGAEFGGHLPGTHPLTVEITEIEHPIANGIEKIEVIDEEYGHKYVEKVERHVVGKFKKRPEGSKFTDMDIIWTREEGHGRVVYIGLGHDEKTWNNPDFQKLVAQSIAWAAGRPRKIEVGKEKSLENK